MSGIGINGGSAQVNYPSLKGEACKATAFKPLVDQTECC